MVLLYPTTMQILIKDGTAGSDPISKETHSVDPDFVSFFNPSWVFATAEIDWKTYLGWNSIKDLVGWCQAIDTLIRSMKFRDS